MENSDDKNFILNCKIVNEDFNYDGEVILLDDDDFIQSTLSLFSNEEINGQKESSINSDFTDKNLLESSTNLIDLTSTDDFDLYDIFMLGAESSYNLDTALNENVTFKKEIVKKECESQNINNLKEIPEISLDKEASREDNFNQESSYFSTTPNSKNKSITCTECLKSFNRSYNYKRHLFLHRIKNNDKLSINQCPNCKREVADRSNFLKHLKICSPDGIASFKSVKKIFSTGPKEFKCSICEKIFLKKYNLNRHLRVHLMNELNRNNEFFLNLNDRFTNKSVKNQIYECERCERRFSTKQLLLYHRDKWHDTRYSCDYCKDMIFEDKLAFIRHLNLNHKIKFKFECKYCKKSFRYISEFIQHRLIHLNKFQINQWDTVDKNFEINSMDFFDVKKNMQCSFCGKNFLKKFNLTRHLRTKHSIENAGQDQYNILLSQKQNLYFEQNKSNILITKL